MRRMSCAMDSAATSGARNKDAMFNFAAHRRIEHYGIIAEQTGVTPPD